MKTKLILILIFLVLFAVITIQNNESVPFRVFFWSFDLPKVILVPALFVLGLLFGLTAALVGRGKKKPAPAPPPKNP
jgi:uncharacterized integral membrane protein